MALAWIQNTLSRSEYASAGAKRHLVHEALKVRVQQLIDAQGNHGGWDYIPLNGGGGRYDLSNTQLAILALREAALAGIEIPDIVWQRTQKLYLDLQKDDGAWNYGSGNKENAAFGFGTPGYGSMTAAGLATLFITADNLDLASGCPCRGGQSRRLNTDVPRRMDLALGWLAREFKTDVNPKSPTGADWMKTYWLYSAERVGIAAGYKYFGTHDWYKEGADYLVKTQNANGSWQGGNSEDTVPATCFAVLFLYKGRAPILYQKLEIPKCQWNNHKRDLANLTAYIERDKEQLFRWQITSLLAPMEELHEAPILYITPETAPQFTPDDEKKLREFTDTGGTILFEASCGNPNVRRWFTTWVKKVWPEWTLKPLGPDHASYADPNPLKRRPEVLGLDDGMRTFLFYVTDDISCAWQTKAYAAREYLFKWGINLFTYAMDRAPLRAKLAAPEKPQAVRYASAIKAGARNTIRLARLKYDGPWTINRNYKPFDRIAAELKKRASITLKADDEGVVPSALGDRDVAYLVGNSKEITLADAEKQALKAYLSKGGFLWAEAAGGAPEFNEAIRKLAAEMEWEFKPIEKGDPILTGKFKAAVGYDLTTGVEFRRVLKVDRAGRPHADLDGIWQDGKRVGVYSPLDAVFASMPYEAYGCRGYLPDDAGAVAINLVLFLTDRDAKE
jgi:hypothetical protein